MAAKLPSMLIYWHEENQYSILSIRSITQPVKQYGEVYFEGETVKATFRENEFPGTIFKLSRNREYLEKEAAKVLTRITEGAKAEAIIKEFTPEAKIGCKQCKQVFIHEQQLAQHMLGTHGEGKGCSTKTGGNGQPVDIVHTCPTCGKVFKTQGNLRVHEKQHSDPSLPEDDVIDSEEEWKMSGPEDNSGEEATPVVMKKRKKAKDDGKKTVKKTKNNNKRNEDEAKKVRQEELKKNRELTKERQKANRSLLTEDVFLSPSKSCGHTEDLKRLERKIDGLYDFMETFLHCKSCMKKAYKNISQSAASQHGQFSSLPQVYRNKSAARSLFTTTPSAFESDETATTSSVIEDQYMSQFDLEESYQEELPISTTSMAEPPVEPPVISCQTPMNVPQIAKVRESHCAMPSGQNDAMTFLGDPKYNYRIEARILTRCEKTAKTAEKLALNLVEFILTQEEIKSITLYGNRQHNKEPMEENKRAALKSHIIRKFGQGKTELEKEEMWEALVKPLNDKIRGMRKGKYHGLPQK